MTTYPRNALVAVAALMIGACNAPSEGEVWRFAIEEPPGSVQDAYAQRFAELVHERTGGDVEVAVYPYGALGTSDHITEQVHNGTLQLAMSSPGHLGKLIPEVQAFLLHFVLSADPEVNARALRDPQLRDFLDELYADKGLAFLTAFGEGEMVWTTRREVRSPQDLRGVRFRVMTSPLLIASYAAYGASPTPLPYGDVYSALQLNMIDAQVNPISAIAEMKFYEVTDFLVFPRHAEFITTLAANPRWLGSLSERQRGVIEDVLTVLQGEILEIQTRENAERLGVIRARRPDMTVIELDASERASFERRAERVHRQFVADVGPRGQALLETLSRAVRGAAAPSE